MREQSRPQQREGLGTAPSTDPTVPRSTGFWAARLPLPRPPGSWGGAKRVNFKYSGPKKGEENSEKEEEKREGNEKEKERGKRGKKKKKKKQKQKQKKEKKGKKRKK